MKARVTAFASVGAVGFVVQLAALTLLSTAGWPVAVATFVAVELAVLQNFWWHERWTWRDRRPSRGGRQGRWSRARATAGRLLRFQVTNGLTSLVSNVALTVALTHFLDLPLVAANVCAVALAGIANFTLADRFVFKPTADARVGRTAARAALAAWLLAAGSAHASPGRETVSAWDAYVAQAESQMGERAPCVPGPEPRGESQGVPGGTIHRWRGCTVLTGQHIDALLQALQHPGTPPPQEDILEAKVLARTPETLHVYLKLKRSAVLTVTYDTEHEVSFNHRSPTLATSRSVATRIAEVDGGDRGFLWRLNSYWRYVQVGADVRVELESLSLSRTVPVLLRPVASPVISRVARESVERALSALRSYTR